MKKGILLLSALLVTTSVMAKKRDCVLEALEGSGIGDVKYSILSEEDFQAVNGTEWELMKGQTTGEITIEEGNSSIFSYLSDTTHASTTSLPDARGMFLRGKNYDRLSFNDEDGTEFMNADGDLLLGAWQEDSFQGHGHNFEGLTDDHNDPTTPLNAMVSDLLYGHTLTAGFLTYAGSIRDLDGYGVARVGLETRPKSVTVNIFVKVKRKCIDTTTQGLIETNGTKIADLEEYNAQNECDSCLTMSQSTLTDLNDKYICFKGEIDAYELDTKKWSVSCTARTVGYMKKVLMLIGENRTTEQNEYLSHLDNQYPYYNVISVE